LRSEITFYVTHELKNEMMNEYIFTYPNTKGKEKKNLFIDLLLVM